MIVHDNKFEELATEPVKWGTDFIVTRQVLDENTGNYVDATPKWESSTVLMEIKIDSVGQMLGQATKKATVKLIGIDKTVAIGDLFQIRSGLWDRNANSGSGAYNYISQGFFIVDTIDWNEDAGSTTVTMYDHMWTAGKTLYTKALGQATIEYPISVKDYAAVIADLIDCKLMDDFDQLPNADYMIQEDLYLLINGATLQTAIMDIAGATGTTAIISDTKLTFSRYDVSSENLTSNELKKLKIGGTYGPVTSVVLGRVPANDNIVIYASTPGDLTITAVNTSTDTLTIEGHGMADGNMVYLTSTNTLPSPLVKDTNYYVSVVDADTFKLAPTYSDAVSETGLINITTVGSGTIELVSKPTQEIQINNNEILDDDRPALLPPLYNSLSGMEWTDVNAETVGLGWHEVGDVIQFTQGSLTVKAFISEIHLTLAGSIKETLVSVVPVVAAIDYQTAGSIIRSIYNTEIKVDKQNQEITSVVSRQDVLEETINENFTEINQDVNDVLITIQRAGGGNILYNSVGFAKESFQDSSITPVSYEQLLYWGYNDPYTVNGNGSITSYQSSESQAAGGISGQAIEMSGTNVLMHQRVTVGVGLPLSFALRVNNVIGTGSARVTIKNDVDSWVLDIDDTSTLDWQEFNAVTPADQSGVPIPDEDPVETFQTTLPWLDVTIQVNNAQRFVFTDLRLLYGATTQGWVQANGEILSANVQFTTDGVRVFDSVHDTETRMTYNEFSTRRKTDNMILFEADDLGVLTNNLTIKGRTSYMSGPDVIIKQLTVGKNNPKSGLAFIKVAEK